jgi:hypothetical protein
VEDVKRQVCGHLDVSNIQQALLTNINPQLLKSRLFNLVDVVDAHRRGKNDVVPTFANVEALEEYTKKTAAYFPRYHEAAGNLLKRVLRKPPSTKSSDMTKG